MMSVARRQALWMCMSVFLLTETILQPVLSWKINHRRLNTRMRTVRTGTNRETESVNYKPFADQARHILHNDNPGYNRYARDLSATAQTHSGAVADPMQMWLKHGGLVYDITHASQFMHNKVIPLPFTTLTILKSSTSRGNVDVFLDYIRISNVEIDDILQPTTVKWSDGRSRGTINLITGSNQAFGTIDLQRAYSKYHSRDLRQSYSKRYAISLKLRPISYLVSMANPDECGAYGVFEPGYTVLKWNASSPKWKAANWVPNVLNFTYGLRSNIFIGQITWDVEIHFGSMQTGDKWDPIIGDFSALLNSDFVFDFALKSGLDPPKRNYLFPYKLSFQFNAVGSHFDGALLSGGPGPEGVVYGMKGEVSYPAIVGLYMVRLVTRRTTTLGIAGGHIYIEGRQVAMSKQSGNQIVWQFLDHEMSYSELPRTGSVTFSKNGDNILHGSGIESGERLTSEDAAVVEYPLHESVASDEDLHLQDLLEMSQFVKSNGNYKDEIQMQSMHDLMGILQYHMDPDLREKYVSVNPINLDPQVKSIAEMEGTNGTDPRTWYRELSIPYITSSLAGTNDKYAKNLNGKRASTWLKSKVGSSDVYQGHSPQLYQNRYLKKYNEMGAFINDQAINPQKHVNDIKTYKQQWLEQVRGEVENKTLLSDMEKMIDKLSDMGVKGKYWAFVFFAYITQPSALMMMQQISISPDHGGAKYTRRIQENCAVMTALDQSSTFVHQYVTVMQNFQLTNMIPALLDYSGDVNHFSYAVNQILIGFIKKYGDDGDPEVRQTVVELQEAMAAGTVRAIMDALQGIAGTVVGIYGWEIIAAKLELFAKGKKWPSRVVRIIGSVVTACAFVGFAMGVKGWDQMDAAERTELILGGSTLATEIIFSIIRRGLALKDVWSDLSIKWYRVDMMLGEHVLIEASKRSLTGFKRWLIGAEDAAVSSTGATEAIEAADSLDIVTRVFGKNLETFMATRITAVLSIINIILISYNMAKGAMDDIEIAENSMFLISACIDLVAAIGSWAVADGILATVFGAMGSIAIAVAFIGAILMIVEISIPQEGPIQEFAEGAAKEAGFYMKYASAIDYFETYQVKGEPQRLRIALYISGEKTCLNIATDGKVFLHDFDYTGKSAFFLRTDGNGYSTISTVIEDMDHIQSYMLAMDTDGIVSGATTRNNSYHLWVATMEAKPITEDSHLKSGKFHLYNVGYYKKFSQKYYLSVENFRIHGNSRPFLWEVTMETLAPGKLKMADIQMYTFQRDQTFRPSILHVGSQPVTWTLSPDLPWFMKFDTDTGAISQKTGVAPTVMTNQSYHMTISNQFGQSQTYFNFNVTEKEFGIYFGLSSNASNNICGVWIIIWWLLNNIVLV